jgi:GxxExxY protein
VKSYAPFPYNGWHSQGILQSLQLSWIWVLEKVYENALFIELVNSGFHVLQQHPIHVFYEKQPVGEYFADLIVNDLVVLELKAAEQIRVEHVSQITNYLKATRKEVGFLLNFGAKPEFRRIVFTNSFQKSA